MNPNIPMIKTLLKFTYGIVPIVAGLDKFTNILTDWGHYLAPSIANIIPFDISTFMKIVGIIEIIAGILVFYKTKIGAYLVMAWLISIAITLIVSLTNFDIAVRDLVMAIGAFTLAKIYEGEEHFRNMKN